jgi:hypothetical protein
VVEAQLAQGRVTVGRRIDLTAHRGHGAGYGVSSNDVWMLPD